MKGILYIRASVKYCSYLLHSSSDYGKIRQVSAKTYRVTVSFVKISALKPVLRVVNYFLFDLGEIRNKRTAHFSGEYFFRENRPKEGCSLWPSM